jgi:hypothetical protein
VDDKQEIERLSLPDLKQLVGKRSGKNRIKIALVFVDTNNFAGSIAEHIGLSPIEVRTKGQSFVTASKQQRLSKEDSWEFGIDQETDDFLGDVLSNFIRITLVPRKARIREVADKCYAKLFIVQYYYSSHNPGLAISRDDLKELAEMGVNIDCDLYCLCTDQ